MSKLQKIKNVSFETLRGYEKASILLNYLGASSIKLLFKYVDDRDIRKVFNTMHEFRVVPVELTKKVLNEFYDMISESTDYIFSAKSADRDVVIEAVGEERARGILGSVSEEATSVKHMDSLEVVDSKSLSNFLINEHPQTIALILAHLEADKRGDVLRRLPEGLQIEVVLRLSQLDHVAPEWVVEVDHVLKKELASVGVVEQASLGGLQPVADMLNFMDKNTEGSIMTRLEERNPNLAEDIRRLMFVFEDIVKIDDRGVQTLLKEIPNDKLLLALKSSGDEVKKKIFSNLSRRAANLLKEDLDGMGPVRLSDVESAQMEIVNIARKLEGEGKLIIAHGMEETFV